MAGNGIKGHSSPKSHNNSPVASQLKSVVPKFNYLKWGWSQTALFIPVDVLLSKIVSFLKLLN